MNAIAINPLHAETNLPASADPVLNNETSVIIVDEVDGANAEGSGVSEPALPVPTEPAPKLPQDEQLALDIENIDKQIEVLTKRREGKATLLANLDKLASIVPGTVLVVTQGRAETTRQVEGVVVGIRDGQYKLSVGEGFDAETVIVRAPQIVEVKPA